VAEGTYKGVPLDELKIDAISWSDEAAAHIRSRSVRQRGATNLEPEWATEAALSDRRMIRLAHAASESTAALKIIGMSESVRGGPRLLKVWVWSDDPRSANWNGGSATLANEADRRLYERWGST
jgi:hypothetical protein